MYKVSVFTVFDVESEDELKKYLELSPFGDMVSGESMPVLTVEEEEKSVSRYVPG